MPWQELILRTLIATIGVTVALCLYTWVLLQVGQKFSGVLKVLLGFGAYLLIVAALLVAFFFTFSAAAGEQRKAWPYLLTVVAGWAVMLLPGVLYMRSKMHLLRQYGYFLPASSVRRR